jgi:hypothetical protein
VPATVIVAITAVAASTGAVDAIEVESLVGDWGFEVGAEKVYFRLSPGDLKSLRALRALWELFGSSSQLRISDFLCVDIRCQSWKYDNGLIFKITQRGMRY